jgi:hypothetical protein
VDFIGLLVDRTITAAMERGEFDTSAVIGADLRLEEQRGPGWWADRLVADERERRVLEDAEEHLARARAAMWRAVSIDELRAAVTAANRRIVEVNGRLPSGRELPLVDFREAVETWQRVRPPTRSSGGRHA